MLDSDAKEIKKLTSNIAVPYNHAANESFAMKMYIGPNDYKALKDYGIDFEQIIPFGWSIFGWINLCVDLDCQGGFISVDVQNVVLAGEDGRTQTTNCQIERKAR